MGGYQCIPLDPKSRTDGVPPALVRKTGPVVQTASGLRPSRHIRRGRCAATGGRDAVAKRCHRESVTRRKPWLLRTSVYSNKEVRWFQTRVRPLSSQQVPSSGQVQNGYPGDHSQQHQTRGLCDLSRPLGCVFPCGNPSSRQEMAQVSLERTELSVSSPAVWSEPVSMDLHSSCQSSDPLAEVTEGSHKCLPGRLAGPGRIPSFVQSTYQSDNDEGQSSGVQSEFGQVGLGTLPEIRFPGYGVRHSRLDCGSEPRAGSDFGEQDSCSQSRKDCQGSAVVFPSRDDGVHGRFASSSTSVQTAPPEGGIQQVLPGRGELEQAHHPRLLVPSLSPPVDSGKLDFGESPSSAIEAHFCPICRCLAHGLGCPYARGRGERQLVRKPQELAYQRPRTGGGWSGTEGSQSVHTPRPRPDCFRQHDSGVLDQSSRRYTCTSSLPVGREAVIVGRPEVMVSVCRASQGQSECHGGSPQQEGFDRADRMDYCPQSPPSCLAAVGQTRRGSVCDKIQCQTSTVRFPSARCASLGSGCHVSELGPAERLRIPPILVASSGAAEGSGVSWSFGASSTMVADCALVQSCDGSVPHTSASSASAIRGFGPATVTDPSRERGGAQSSRLALCGRSCNVQGCRRQL